ncbi:MAG: 4-hydroxybenzoate octaprenyltransferase [Thiohalobacterales bacterium]
MSLFVTERLREYALLMRLDKPIGFFLLLWPTLWALLIAGEGQPDAQVLLVFILGVLLMRSAGCVINDFADTEIDRHVARTQNRPLAAGRIRKTEAIVLFVLLCLMALGLVLLLNTLTVMMSFVGVLLAATYPFMKRLTYLPQVYLGAAFGWAVPMAFAAQTGSVPPIAWLLFTTTVLWATAYDTMYAMVDRGDDLALGVKSTAILFGESDRLIIGVIQVMVLVSLVMVGVQVGLGWFYYAGVCVAGVLVFYQQWLIRYRERKECFRAFLNNHWFGAAVFAGLLLDYFFQQI